MSSRKRKPQETYIRSVIREYQKEIIRFLETISKAQMDNFTKLRKELREIKTKMCGINETTRFNIDRNVEIELEAIESENRCLREKLKNLEKTLIHIKKSAITRKDEKVHNYFQIKCLKGPTDKDNEILAHNKNEVTGIQRIEDVPPPKKLAEQISKLRASQSPIAISVNRCPTWSSLDPLKFKGYWNNDSHGVLLNTGQTAYFTFDSATRPILSGGPLIGEYIFEQMHFHWSVDDFTGCEHVLDGHGYAAECHLVHYNSKYESMEVAVANPDGLAVVGFLLEAVDAPNPSFDWFVEALDQIKKQDNAVQLPSASLAWMDRAEVTTGSYVTYKGSLTTPPYTECVTWIIYEKPVQIGSEQLGLLRQLEGVDKTPIERNVRPTQRHPPGHSVIYVKQVKAKL
ncbi:carbonic anhydrase 1 isoform X2 [Pieris brassicae]|nr:carbonic anhydrase 1 isoform X2 [Pieris brassicae]